MQIKTTYVKALVEQPGKPDAELAEVVLRCDNRDMVRYDLLRERKSWPQGHQAPMLWLTVQTWSALNREKHELAGASVEDFLTRCVLINRVNEDGSDIDPNAENADGEPVNPTQPGAESDS